VRVLIDECAPRALKRVLAAGGHNCETVQERGWSGKKNGELLNLAENQFDVLVTLDTNLRYQQNLAGRGIAIVVLVARSSRMDDLIPLFPGCLDAVTRIKPGQIIGVGEKLKDNEA
jgi:predicted nuclease of predicted toxin-antitoxin system